MTTFQNPSLKEVVQAWQSQEPFVPLFRNGHWQTIVARYWPSSIDTHRFPVQTRLFETEPGVRVLANYHRSRDDSSNDTLLIVHGLEGSSTSPYVQRTAAQALEAGFHVVRLNIRNCGGTEHLGPTLYHSGLTTDVCSVAEQLTGTNLFLVGYSMGGNMILKLAGEWAENPPPHVKAVCAVSPPIDLAACALRIAEPRNHIYETRFLRRLRQTLTQKHAVMPVNYSLEHFKFIRTLIDFDNVYTAPAFGFRDAFDYYAHASSNRVLDSIHVPALVIHARDDPFVPFSIFNHSAFRENPFLQLLAPAHGGHVAFISRRRPRFWAEDKVLQFCRWVQKLCG